MHFVWWERMAFQDKGYTAYRFRHTYCTRLCRAQLAPKLIARLMGDRDITMIMRVYNSINQKDIEKASEEYASQIGDFLEAGTLCPSFFTCNPFLVCQIQRRSVVVRV
jgi:hypothetical protein